MSHKRHRWRCHSAFLATQYFAQQATVRPVELFTPWVSNLHEIGRDIHTHTCMHSYVHTSIHTHMRMHINARKHMHVCIHTSNIYTYAFPSYACTLPNIHIRRVDTRYLVQHHRHTSIPSHKQKYKCTHAHVRAHDQSNTPLTNIFRMAMLFKTIRHFVCFTFLDVCSSWTL